MNTNFEYAFSYYCGPSLFHEVNAGFANLNFRWRNQRQKRKNLRRAHAAGYKVF